MKNPSTNKRFTKDEFRSVFGNLQMYRKPMNPNERAQKEAERLLRERQEIESMVEEDVEEEAKKVILWN